MSEHLSTQPCGCDPAALPKSHFCKEYPRCTYGRTTVQFENDTVPTPTKEDAASKWICPYCRIGLFKTNPDWENLAANHLDGHLSVEVRTQPTSPVRNAKWRKERPVYSGVLSYFPDALLEVSHVSFLGNEQHNPGQPLHWSRDKSADHLDCVARHLIDNAAGRPTDGDTGLHLAKVAWRALAELQLYLEKRDA